MAELTVERAGEHEFVARNDRGAAVRIGRNGMTGSFSPGELLQVAIAGCTAVTVEQLLVRRGVSVVTAHAGAVRSADGHEYERIEVVLEADLSFLDEATHARVVEAMRRAVERECKVSRTVERGAEVSLTFRTRA